MLDGISAERVNEVNLAIRRLEDGRVGVFARVSLDYQRLAPSATFICGARNVQRRAGIVLGCSE